MKKINCQVKSHRITSSESQQSLRQTPGMPAHSTLKKQTRLHPAVCPLQPLQRTLPALEKEVCYKLYEAPYVCNGCPDKSRRVLRKRYYLHKQAHTAKCCGNPESVRITKVELLGWDAVRPH
jgi:hypothetical protein